MDTEYEILQFPPDDSQNDDGNGFEQMLAESLDSLEKFNTINVENLKQFFRNNGRLPTEQEKIILKNYADRESTQNLLLSSYSAINFYDTETAEIFSEFIDKLDLKRDYLKAGDICLSDVKYPKNSLLRPGDEIVFLSLLPYDAKLRKLCAKNTYFSLSGLLDNAKGFVIDLSKFPFAINENDLSVLDRIPFVAADPAVIRKMRSLSQIPGNNTVRIFTVGTVTSDGNMSIINADKTIAALERSALVYTSGQMMHKCDIYGNKAFLDGIYDTADAYLRNYFYCSNGIVVNGEKPDVNDLPAYKIGVYYAENILSALVSGCNFEKEKRLSPFEKGNNLLYAINTGAKTPRAYLNAVANLLPGIRELSGRGITVRAFRLKTDFNTAVKQMCDGKYNFEFAGNVIPQPGWILIECRTRVQGCLIGRAVEKNPDITNI